MKLRYFYIAAFLTILAAGCDKYTYVNGEYSAIFENYNSEGYKGFMNISMVEDAITEVDFDYVDSNGNRLSNDADYEQSMLDSLNIKPSELLNTIESQCANASIIPQFEQIDPITDVTYFTDDANKLLEAALEIARQGEPSEVIVQQ